MRVYWDLQALTPSAYERTLTRFTARISGLSGVVAVARFGSLAHPGISDLDVLVVVRDDVGARTLEEILTATRADGLARYLFTHPPIVVPESVTSEVRWVHTLYGLQPVWGESPDLPPPPAEVRPWLVLAEYADFTFAVRSVLRSVGEGEVGLRSLLLLLRSCVHSLRLAEELLGSAVGRRAVDLVEDLRLRTCEGFFGVRQAKEALAAVVRALREADRELAGFLVRSGVISPQPLRECVPWADGRYYLFEQPLAASECAVLRRVVAPWWHRVGVDPSVDVYPAFYLAQFSVYAHGSGPYGRVHRALFGTRAAEWIREPAYATVLRRRVAIVERIHAVTRRGGLLPMVPLGIGFRDPDRIQPSRRRRWLRGLVLRQLAWGRA